VVSIGILFLFSFIYFSLGYQYFNLTRYHYDEGLIAYGAIRILNGDIPYRNFWTLYFPGQFYLLAAVFKIFGISVKVKVFFAIAILASIICCIYILVNRFTLKKIALLSSFLSLAWLKTFMVYNRPSQVAILFSILSCFPVFNFIHTNRNKWLIAAGILVGITTLFRQDFGFYTFISIFLLILLKQLSSFAGLNYKMRMKSIFIRESYFLIGILLIILPFFIYFIYNSALRDLVSDAIVFPLLVYPKVRWLTFPKLTINNLIFYLPLVIYVLTVVRLLIYIWGVKSEGDKVWCMLLFLFLGIGLFNYVRVRTNIDHLLPVLIPAIILFALLYDDLLKRFITKLPSLYRHPIWIVTFLICLDLLYYPIKSILPKLNLLRFPSQKTDYARLDIARAQGFYDSSDFAQSQLSAIKYIQSKTEKGEKIYVGNTRHDKIANNDIIFYFLSERHSATRYYELHPGLTTTRDVQREIIDEIKHHNVRYIVLWKGFEDIIEEPNESSKSSGVTLLDNFIQKNYKIEKAFGPYLILRRI
jgi:hypothetical protein